MSGSVNWSEGRAVISDIIHTTGASIKIYSTEYKLSSDGLFKVHQCSVMWYDGQMVRGPHINFDAARVGIKGPISS